MLSSCALMKKLKGGDAEETVTTSSDANHVVDAQEKDLFLMDDKKEEVTNGATEQKPAEEPVVAAEEPTQEQQPMVEEQKAQEAQSPKEEIAVSDSVPGTVGEYVIEKGDTLMIVAFKLLGDYTKWKTIMDHNPGISYGKLPVGKKLKYPAPEIAFKWAPHGSPYLILLGDSLSRISGKVYGKPARWHEIHENNKPMIKNPNLIFAGFTLYYLPDRKVASEAPLK